MEKKKDTYKPPKVNAYGSLAELTKGSGGPYPDSEGGGSNLG